MPTIEHKVLTSTDLHEPKGAAGAALNQVYRSNGSGTGAWQKIYTHGWEDFNHGGASQSPAAATWTDLNNNGTGPFTDATYRLPGKSAIWNVSTNQFEWSSAGLTLGDVVDIRFDFEITTVNPNEVLRIRLDLAHGDPAEYTLPFIDESIKNASTQQFVYSIPVYMGDTDTLNNPCKVAARFDGAGNSITVNGWFIRTIPINPVFST